MSEEIIKSESEEKPAEQKRKKRSVKEIMHASGLSETKLVEAIQSGELDPRHLHFENRLAVVAILRASGRRNYDIAAFLKCSLRTVEHYVKRLKDNQDHLVRNLTVEKVAGYLCYQADIMIQNAMRKENYALAWHIQSQLIDKLQGMGVVYRKPLQIDQTIDAKVEGSVEFKQQNELFEHYQRKIFGTSEPSAN